MASFSRKLTPQANADLSIQRGHNAALYQKAGMFSSPQAEQDYISKQGRRRAKGKPFKVNSQGNTQGETLRLGILGRVQ